MYDEYLTEEMVPFVHHHCRGWQPITTLGASLGAYYAVNALLKHPDVFKRCFGLSGVYDMKQFMGDRPAPGRLQRSPQAAAAWCSRSRT